MLHAYLRHAYSRHAYIHAKQEIEQLMWPLLIEERDYLTARCR